MLYMNLQVSVRHQKQSGEGMLHGRDICWVLLALLAHLVVQLPRVWILGEALSCSCCPQLGSEFVANEEFSTLLPSHGQSAPQQEPEIFRL